MKTTIQNIVTASVKVTNAADAGASYSIVAHANVSESGNVSSFNQGEVKKGEQIVATFNQYGEGKHLSVSYQGAEIEEQAAILADIHDFVESAAAEAIKVKELVK